MDWAKRYVCSPWHTIFCESTNLTSQQENIPVFLWLHCCESKGEGKKTNSKIAKEKKKNKMQTAEQQSQNPSSQKSTDTIQEGMAELRTSFLKCQNWGENVFYLCSVLSLKYLNTKRSSKPGENHCAVSQHWACAGLIQMATSTPMWRTELFSFARGLTRLIFRSCSTCEGQQLYPHLLTAYLINIRSVT